MPISGYVAAGASDALEEVLDRRLKEQIRRQQEKEHADNVAHQQAQLELQRQTAGELQQERLANRARQQQQDDIAAAGRLGTELAGGGEINEEAFGVLNKDPAMRGRLHQRPIIDARPIAAQSVLPGSVAPESAGAVSGGALPPEILGALGPEWRNQADGVQQSIGAAPASPMASPLTKIGGTMQASTDASGPQKIRTFDPTRAEAEKQKQIVDLAAIGKELARQPDEAGRIMVASRRPDLPIRADLIQATEGEKATIRAREAANARAEADQTWREHHRIEVGDRPPVHKAPEFVQMPDGSYKDINNLAPAGSKPITAAIVQKQVADAASQEKALAAMQIYGDDMLSVINRLVDEKGNLKPGAKNVIGKYQGRVPEGGFFDESSQEALSDINRLMAMVDINKLAEMKNQSRTGATGFGSLSAPELGIIEASGAKLRNRKQGEVGYGAEIKRLRDAVMVSRKEKKRNQVYNPATGQLEDPKD